MRAGRAAAGLGVAVAVGAVVAGCSSSGSPAPVSSVAITGPRATAGETRTDQSSASAPGTRSTNPGAENRTSSATRTADCPLVTGATVAAAFGLKVSTTSTTTPIGRPSCRFAVRSGVVGGTIVVTSGPAQSTQVFTAAGSAARGRRVGGLGLGAYLTEDPATVHVRRAEDVLTVSASLGEPGGARQDTYRLRDALIKVARAAG